MTFKKSLQGVPKVSFYAVIICALKKVQAVLKEQNCHDCSRTSWTEALAHVFREQLYTLNK